MNEWWAVFYGFIQGVTEFLPVSSSGHLALIPHFFELQDPGVFFDLLMHFGTAMAVILYFRNDVKILVDQGLALLLKRDVKNSGFFQNFMLATFFSFILILVIKKTALAYGRNPLFIGSNFVVFGILMYLSDRRQGKGLDLTKRPHIKQAILVGLSQSIAIFPGVSRSGITLTTSRFLGMGRVEAGRFSFLLSLPVIIGGIVFKVPEILSGSAVDVSFNVIVIGILSSFIFGLLTIHFFLKLISRFGLVYYSLYRFLIAALLFYFNF